jgi:hypothetical protein
MITDTYFPIKDKDIEYPCRFGMGAITFFQEMTQKDIDDIKKELTYMEAIQLFFCSIKSGCVYNRMKFDLDFDDILRTLEDHPEYLLTFQKLIFRFFGITDKMMEEFKNTDLNTSTEKK